MDNGEMNGRIAHHLRVTLSSRRHFARLVWMGPMAVWGKPSRAPAVQPPVRQYPEQRHQQHPGAAHSGARTTPAEYARAVEALLRGEPGILAQNVGLPDPVIYRSAVATGFEKHLVEVTGQTWPTSKPDGAEAQAGVLTSLASAGTDPLALTIDVCRKQGVPIVASYG